MLTGLRLENFKSWRDTGNIRFRPITGFFGTNSSGKTGLLQPLLLMKQTVDSSDRGNAMFHFGDDRTLVDLGNFESVIRGHDTSRHLAFSLDWQLKRECELSEAIGGGAMDEGLDIGFRIRAGMGRFLTRESLMLEEMGYHLCDGRRFGIKTVPGEFTYEIFATKKNGEVQKYRSDPFVDRFLTKFFDFPYWASKPFGETSAFFELEYDLRLFLADVYHLGPLRAKPNRIYARSGVHPMDVGSAGESVVDAIVSSRERGVMVELSEGKTEGFVQLEQSVSYWLKRLGLAEDFAIQSLTQDNKWYKVGISTTEGAPQVAITDVGVGVSQILPILVLCNYVPADSTVLLEQPEIHLHPAVQARLADVFIDAFQKNEVQIVFESHSEHLLRRLQRRIAEGELSEHDVSLFFCSIQEDGESVVGELEVDQCGNIANWPKDFFGDQFGEVAAMSEAALSKTEERKRSDGKK